MPLARSRLFRGLALALVVGFAALAPARALADTVIVFAAASMKNAMDDITAAYTRETGHTATVSLAGSSALARQIEAGAPADIFISANTDWMDRLEKAGMIDARSRFDLVGNTLVLIAHGHHAAPVAVGPDLDLAGMLGDGHLAMALVEAVPAGIYGKAALTSLGLWDAVAPHVAQADNVRAALALVSTGEAPLGIVYATDAAADDSVTVIGTFPAGSHTAIVYPVALISGHDTPPATEFLAYLRGPAARDAFARQGFSGVAD